MFKRKRKEPRPRGGEKARGEQRLKQRIQGRWGPDGEVDPRVLRP